MNPLYIRYCINRMAFFVFRDVGAIAEEISGPWSTEGEAKLSLEVQS